MSTASEPGEGEHKIIRFIKDQRRRPGYDPKTKHVIFGQDADLILLTLLTHEPHFRILRENLSKSKPHEIPDFSEMDIGRLRQRLKYGLDPFRDPEDEEETPVSEENVEDSDSAAGSETEKQDEIEPLAENEAQEENEIEPLPEKETESQPHPPDFDIERTLEDFVCLTFLVRRYLNSIVFDFGFSWGTIFCHRFRAWIFTIVLEDWIVSYKHIKESENNFRQNFSPETVPSTLNSFIESPKKWQRTSSMLTVAFE